jgi:hypothetical protein
MSNLEVNVEREISLRYLFSFDIFSVSLSAPLVDEKIDDSTDNK